VSYPRHVPPSQVSDLDSHDGRSLDQNDDNAGSEHAERARRTERYIDHPASHEGSAVVDAAMDRMTGIGHGDDAPERAGSMRAGHFALVAPAAIVRRIAAFSLGRRGQTNQSDCNERMPIQCYKLFSSFDVGTAWRREIVRAATDDAGRNPTNDPGGDPNIRHRQTTAAKQ
jgi:hypothetical protein